MISAVETGARQMLGLDADTLTVWQMGLRALLVYLVAIALVRLGEKRFIGKFAAFDVILGIMLGSIMSGAITGSTPFFPTLAAACVLVGLHYLFAAIAFRSDWFGTVVKGGTRTLVEEGQIQWDAMQNGHISRNDLLGALRENGSVAGPEAVQVARLERSGNISIIKREDSGSGGSGEPHIVEVTVQDGVQTVRIEIR